MEHLNIDELLDLAEASSSQEGFEDSQIEKLEHLKTCTDCYESFCILSVFTDMMDEGGSYVPGSNEAVNDVKETAKAAKARLLARFKVVRNTAANVIETALEQIDQTAAVLQFGPSLAMATRGGGKTDKTAIRLEEFTDDKTYIVFKPEANEIIFQINLRDMDVENLHVYIEAADSGKTEIQISKQRNIVTGSMSNVPNDDFQIIMEAE